MRSPVSLLISDVDGTLLTRDKRLTPASVEAVRELRARGVTFAVTSSRPTAGMRMLEAPLAIDSPLAGFNGGLFVKPGTHEPLLALELDAAAVARVLGVLEDLRLEPWVYTADRWLVRDPGPRVDHEAHVVQLAPTQVPDFRGLHAGVLKIVGVSDDPAAVAQAEGTLADEPVSARRSQPYYVDVTAPGANKGQVVVRLAQWLDIPQERIAVIGDAQNDVSMFEQAGLAIAMGNAPPEVQARAAHVTASNEEDGFAAAVRRHVLGDPA